MRQKKFKRCPRCDKKTPIFQDRCEGCGLVFSRLSKATNTAAKKAIRKKEYNKVILDKVLPVDVNKWKLFLWALFLGWFGAHYAKVGRYKTFTYMIVSAAMVYVACALLPFGWMSHEYLFLVMWALILPGSVGAMIWVISTFSILFNNFKVPISIDEELVKESLDQEIVDDILKTVKGKKEKDVNKKSLKTILEEEDKKEENEEPKQEETKTEEKKVEKSKKVNRISVVCASCGRVVKVREDETICPKCDEPLKED